MESPVTIDNGRSGSDSTQDSPLPQKRKQLRFERRGRNHRAEALARANLTEEMVRDVQKVSHRLAKVAGGHASCIEALRGDDAADSISFVQAYDKISPHDRDYISLEEVCVMAGITSRRLVEIVSGAIMMQGEEDVRLIVASYRPAIVQKTAEEALTTLGEKDREMFHKHTEFLPPTRVNVNMDNRRQTQNNFNGKQEAEDAALPPPKAGGFLLEISSILRPNTLPSEAPEPIVLGSVPPLEGEYEDSGDV